MIVNFHINYYTKQDEFIVIQYKRNGHEAAMICQSYDSANWHTALEMAENDSIVYQYGLQTPKGIQIEQGAFRELSLPKGVNQIFCHDYWRGEYEAERSFFSAAFKDVIFKRETVKGAKAKVKTASAKSSTKNRVVFQLYAAAIPKHLHFCLLGKSDEAEGHDQNGLSWQKPLVMSDAQFPLWQAEIEVNANRLDLEYKFAIYDAEQERIVEWEKGENRVCRLHFPSTQGNALVLTDEQYRYASGLWRGAGVAIPVFSLRSEKGMGIGEFADLHLLADWAASVEMKLVQILPVNDTIATKTWTDSYPYAAISVFALHPLYVNIQRIAKLKDKKAEAKLNAAIAALNALETVDFEQVMNIKFEFFKLLYAQEKDHFWSDKQARTFIEENADWLKPYAAFCHLRDVNKTVQFPNWKKYATYSPQVIADICTPQYKAFDELALYYFIQYHAHQQLFAATEYARSKSVVLKGDLPIGIYRYSCDAWVAPELYNMDGQAGAPPDAYAVAGQNWGFPTYNWAVMAQDNFAWWRQRMTKLSQYFDALRIDHILGFFRIWQIPIDQVEGTLGLFNPRLPYSRQELAAEGLMGNLDRYTKPYIRGHFLTELFGQDADFVRTAFLTEVQYNEFKLNEAVETQVKIKQLFATDKKYADKKHLEKSLMNLVGEVLLIEEPLSQGTAFNPRITVHTTRSYRELSDYEKQIINRLYDDYFYRRHDEFWRQQAMWKLPALLKATNMLICGEDLGMIPNSVPKVMHDLNIITLEIQRMPKGATEFGDTERYPYMSVCSPSCHDMSTIRGWWEGDAGIAQRFFQKYTGRHEFAPRTCTPEIVEFINRQHLNAPSMWAIFPIQDLIGMDASLRRPNAADEQINEPSNPQHYWRFRFHLPLEQLNTEGGLNAYIASMVKASGR
jgi:4-alpha-glucanotransferase